jgi:hypothetical protein
MFVVDWLVQAAFGTLYGGLIMVIALLAAIPYGAWQGIKRLGRWTTGGRNGDTKTGS